VEAPVQEYFIFTDVPVVVKNYDKFTGNGIHTQIKISLPIRHTCSLPDCDKSA
jgi:hypothetical protein